MPGTDPGLPDARLPDPGSNVSLKMSHADVSLKVNQSLTAFGQPADSLSLSKMLTASKVRSLLGGRISSFFNTMLRKEVQKEDT